jgi:hypothetical protein
MSSTPFTKSVSPKKKPQPKDSPRKSPSRPAKKSAATNPAPAAQAKNINTVVGDNCAIVVTGIAGLQTITAKRR